MATYPDIPGEFRLSVLVSKELNLAPSAQPQQTEITEVPVHRITIVHKRATVAQRDSVRSFYATNKRILTTVDPQDGRTYDCLFEQEPMYRQDSATSYDITVRFIGTKN